MGPDSHFYYDFYAYQYATGFAAATALANKVSYGATRTGPTTWASKVRLLRLPAGNDAKAGVDMTQADYLEDARDFARRLDEFTDLIKGLHK